MDLPSLLDAHPRLAMAATTLAGVHLPSPWSLYRRAAVALVRFLKGAPMTPSQIQAISQDVKIGIDFTVQLVETMLSGADGASKKAKAVEILSTALTAGEQALKLPGIVIAVTTNPAVLGFLIDQAVAEANALGLFGAAATVPQAPAAPVGAEA
jgi:hypothetical protein